MVTGCWRRRTHNLLSGWCRVRVRPELDRPKQIWTCPVLRGFDTPICHFQMPTHQLGNAGSNRMPSPICCELWPWNNKVSCKSVWEMKSLSHIYICDSDFISQTDLQDTLLFHGHNSQQIGLGIRLDPAFPNWCVGIWKWQIGVSNPLNTGQVHICFGRSSSGLTRTRHQPDNKLCVRRRQHPVTITVRSVQELALQQYGP